ncbi:MAG TPA: hypothetical protein PLI95_05355 [Polyangiaceae bacterium]|nr:hypothetical protein [Polyangiaceae bacterium]
MATRAQHYRFQEEIRHGADKPKAAPKETRKHPSPALVKTNRYADTGAHATRQYQGSQSERPPRKSTRRSANRIKADSQLQRRQTRRARSPKVRAIQAAVRKRSGRK